MRGREKKLIYIYIWRRQWHPTPRLLPGKSHGWRSLVGCSPWGHSESDMTFTFHFHALEKEMATHSSVLAWRIPGTREPGGCHLWGHTESNTTEVTQHSIYTSKCSQWLPQEGYIANDFYFLFKHLFYNFQIFNTSDYFYFFNQLTQYIL